MISEAAYLFNQSICRVLVRGIYNNTTDDADGGRRSVGAAGEFRSTCYSCTRWARVPGLKTVGRRSLVDLRSALAAFSLPTLTPRGMRSLLGLGCAAEVVACHASQMPSSRRCGN